MSVQPFAAKMNNGTNNIFENPKFRLLDQLQKKCLSSNESHSNVLSLNSTVVNTTNVGGLSCPRTFDGLTCWDQTPAAEIAYQKCPEFIIGFDSRRPVFKECLADGNWFTRVNESRPWTNYTSCVDMEDLKFRSKVNDIYIYGYIISAFFLVISIIIFRAYRSLICTRIHMHTNLFIALAANNILWVIWYMSVVAQPDVVQENLVWCQALHVVMNYFMLSSYIWMFCEGLHLHVALVVVFVRDEVAMRWFMALGWGLSMLIVGIYATVRLLTPGATERCWMDQSDSMWIMSIPVSLTLAISFCVLMNVVRVLITKSFPPPTHHNFAAAKKAARAAFLLIPLFGLQYILIPLRPPRDSPLEPYYEVISAFLISTQGLWVSVLFCFTNSEVLSATRASLTNCRRNNEAIAMTGITAGDSLAPIRENAV